MTIDTGSRPQTEESEGQLSSFVGEIISTHRWVLLLPAVPAISLALYHLVTSYTGIPEPYRHRATHLLGMLLVVFLTQGLSPSASRTDRLWNVGLSIAVLSVAGYIYFEYEALVRRFTGPTNADLIFGSILILLVLEATRRYVGKTITVVAIFFLSYSLIGRFVPGRFGHGGFSYRALIDTTFVQTTGIFGVPMGASAVFIVIFVIFGSFLAMSGAGVFFIDLAYALTGRSRGGPAKSAVVASALTGTLSGSAVANVVTTGAFTIPLMIRSGLRRPFAGAVEAAASTGGSFMPPVMSAVGFFIAQYTGLSYGMVMLHALVPAVLYFVAIFLMIHLESLKEDIAPVERDRVPDLKDTLRSGGHFLIPVVALFGMLAYQITPMRAGFYAILLIVALSWIRPATRMGPRKILEALELGVRSAAIITVTCAVAGLIVGSVSLNGLGIKFSSALIALAGGQLLLLLFLTMVACIILGLGMPIVPAYVIVTALGVPALVEAGVPLIAAHFFVFYFSALSGLTPPVALSAYAAAGIANCSPVRTATVAVKVAAAGFLIPYLFALDSRLLLIDGTTLDYVRVVVTALGGVAALSVALQGWAALRCTWYERILAGGLAIALAYPTRMSDLVGIAMLAVFLALHAARFRQAQEPSISLPEDSPPLTERRDRGANR